MRRSYDGIYCENCGHSNDEPGYEEVSEAEQWVENMTTLAMFDAEESRMEKTESFFSGFDDDCDDEEDF